MLRSNAESWIQVFSPVTENAYPFGKRCLHLQLVEFSKLIPNSMTRIRMEIPIRVNPVTLHYNHLISLVCIAVSSGIQSSWAVRY